MDIKGVIATIAIMPNASVNIFPPMASQAPIAIGNKNVAVIGPDATPPESKAIAVNISGTKNDNIIANQKGNIKNEIHLKPGEYFALGDNRDNSIDSRFDEIGIIYEDEIIGKVIN